MKIPTAVENRFFALPAGAVTLQGNLDEKIRLVCRGTLEKIDFSALVAFFRNKADAFATGEFWGKLTRAACLCCRYTGDPALRKILDATVEDMLSVQRADGCISTVPDEKQPNGTHGSDLWERKYVLTGLLSYYQLTNRPAVLDAARRLALYTARQVGLPPKTPITKTGWCFAGMESSSILSAIVQTYVLTGEEELLAFANEIVESGACGRENIFQAILNGKFPKDIGDNGNPKESVAKAYEMMSCFEGLLAYYRLTGKEWCFACVKTFWQKLVDTEITLLGSGGADAPYNFGPGTGEQWNFTKFEQTNPDINLAMETCVTVYWMRLCHEMLCLTGECLYADQIEKSLYNAILGAIRPDGAFFEYFPRFNGARNPVVNYSFNINGFDLSCCTANGPTGLCMAPYVAFMATNNGPVINFYENGEFVCGDARLTVESKMPAHGAVTVRVTTGGEMVLRLRVPAYAENFIADVNGKTYVGRTGQYLLLPIEPGESVIAVTFQIPLTAIPAPSGSNRAGDAFTALTYGSILLARDSRFGRDPLAPVSFTVHPDYAFSDCRFANYISMEIREKSGSLIRFCDYASAGGDWKPENTFASWIPNA